MGFALSCSACRLLLPATLSLLLAGCGDSYSPDTYATRAVQQANKVEQGTVIGVRPVNVSAEGSTGTAAGAAAGGVLGVGGHRVAIPVEQFSWDADKGAFKMGTTVAELKQMPEWVEGSQQTATGSSVPPRDLNNKPSDSTKNPSNGAGDSSR
jgi:hypothetical protein